MKAFDEMNLQRSKAPLPNKPKSEASRSEGHAGPGGPLGRNHVLHLQRTAGNSAVAQLLAGDEEHEGHDHGGTGVRDVVGRGGGDSLPATTKSSMENFFGQDFSDVRVHTGQQAESSAQSVAAKAYTVGNEIVLGHGAPSLESSEGQRTLAHELTHVVQQRSGPVSGTEAPGGISVSDPSDRFEQQAEEVASSLQSGGALQTAEANGGDSAGLGATAGSVQREAEEDEADESEAEED